MYLYPVLCARNGSVWWTQATYLRTFSPSIRDFLFVCLFF
eukprot:COSAG05_NODE_12107_length_483_cov_0.880208_1_plen_39_part_10